MQKNMALIVVDVQNGFTPGGNLAVAGSDQIIPKINQLGDYFDTIVLTQDWHPENHISFADNHPDQQAFQTIELDYGTQVLWPRHCVQGTQDAELHPDLDLALYGRGIHQTQV
jgi:nicotinamidase/pyrazinamidase